MTTHKEEMKIVLQNVIFRSPVEIEPEMYYRLTGTIEEKNDGVRLGFNSMITTDTYMNLFDYPTWKEYTGLDNVTIIIVAKGKGRIQICSGLSERKVLTEKTIEDKQKYNQYEIRLEVSFKLKEVFLKIISEEGLEVEKISFVTERESTKLNEVNLSLVICTYHREKMLVRNLNRVAESLFFNRKSMLFGRMNIRVIDNGSSLEMQDSEYVHIYRNPNTGGSGGFIRGIKESLATEKKEKTSHIILMDDDVEILNETFYRLYALLILIKSQYAKKVIGGRMFRDDLKSIQYTALEIWNGGDIIHVAGNKDMKDIKNLKNVNDVQGEYTGWWFGCFPISFCKKNLPLPFFLHCDDVEYGLRNRESPMVLNGIQVWHETYEYRRNPIIIYYDMRNTLIVNTIHHYFDKYTDVLLYWKNRMGRYYAEKKYDLQYASIIALLDYTRGSKHFLGYNCKKVLVNGNNFALHLVVIVLWRIVALVYTICGEKAFLSYKNLLCEEKQK